LLPQSAPRYTLDELLHDIAEQSAGLVKADDFSPSNCDHPLCGLHGDFIVLPDRSLKALHQHKAAVEAASCCEPTCCSGPDAAAKNRAFVGRYWQRTQTKFVSQDDENCCCADPSELDLTDMDQFLSRVKSHGFTISAMAFQDAATLDIARLRQCSLHVFAVGRHVPFCSYYL
jgi:hypothetical protein